MHLILALCLISCFGGKLPTAFSLRCYACFDYLGSTQPCNNPSIQQCDSGQDSCRSFVTTAEMYGMQHTTTMKNCSISLFECNSGTICNYVNQSITSDIHGTLLACSVNCCYGDLCNGQGNSTMPPWTNTSAYPPMLTTPHPSACTQVVNNVLESPGYPSKYPSNKNCVANVSIPFGAALNITFEHFDLEFSYTCSFDYLKITNDNGGFYHRYCGNLTGQSVIVTGQYANLTFRSDFTVEKTGFRLLIFPVYGVLTTHRPTPTTQSASACRKVVNNVLESPGYPNMYPRNKDCVANISIPAGGTLNITFEHFDLEYHYSCSFDYLEIANDNGGFYHKYCGSLTGHSVIVTGRYANLTFHSDVVVQKTGFRLLFFPVYSARINRAIKNVDIGTKSAGRQKQDIIKTTMLDELKKKATLLISKVKENKSQSDKKKTLVKLGEKKRDLHDGRMLIQKTVEAKNQ
ncbi:tolloid-like protein 2 [Montipora foliosa]|uniref:tolloid-like protein 2 n=1 Tax=Montipora foliosa TaxID=591990 RepID=UPI0035F1DE83